MDSCSLLAQSLPPRKRGNDGSLRRNDVLEMEPAGLLLVLEDEAQGDVRGGDRLAVAVAGAVAGGGDAAFGAPDQGGLFGRVDRLYADVGGPACCGHVQ